ncbi:MAG TPA: hypothetical protein VMU81_01475 [Acetobacteraceae bacterium]|nr:hypothetical protein [Acetobacteraceae bacterium]
MIRNKARTKTDLIRTDQQACAGRLQPIRAWLFVICAIRGELILLCRNGHGHRVMTRELRRGPIPRAIALPRMLVSSVIVPIRHCTRSQRLHAQNQR